MTIHRTSCSRSTALRWMCSILGVSGTALGTLSCTDAVDDSNTIAIGLLLPFSGAEAGTSANFERAAILAVERVNAAGGIRGKRLRLVEADTHSNLSRSIESTQRIIQDGAAVVLGVESSDIAGGLAPMFLDRNLALLSPLVGTANDTSVNCTKSWFRMAPSARSLGESLAKLLSANHVPSAVVLSATDLYSKAFGNAVTSRFIALGGSVPLHLEIDPTAQSYGTLPEQVRRTGVSSVVLATSPSAAAWIVNEFYVDTFAPIDWYLSPLLKTQLVIQNVAPGFLDGARGVAPKIFETRDTFSRTFQSRWAGDLPLEGAHFYYDTVAVAAYALQHGLPADGRPMSAEEFMQSMSDVTSTRLIKSRTRGEPTGWDDFELGLEGIAAGQPMYYTGLTGSILFDECGARSVGASGAWSIQAGEFVNDPEN